MELGRTGDEHLREWADLHRTDTPTGFVSGWLRASGAVARPLVRAGISANTVTMAALGAAVAAVGLAIVPGWPGPAAACTAVTVSGLLDSLDGAVAVQAGRSTRVGFLLDSVLDRVADVAFCATLAIVAGGRAGWVAVAAAAAAWWLEYVRARAGLADTAGPARQAQVITPGERPTRIVLTIVGLGVPPLALAALWGQVVIVGGSAAFLLAHFVRRLHGQDVAAADGHGNRPTPTT